MVSRPFPLCCFLLALGGWLSSAPASAQGGLGDKNAEERGGDDDRGGAGKRRLPPPPDDGGGTGGGGGGGSVGGGSSHTPPGPNKTPPGAGPRGGAATGGGAPPAMHAPPAPQTGAPLSPVGEREPLEWWDWWMRHAELYLEFPGPVSATPWTPRSDGSLEDGVLERSEARRALLAPVFLSLLQGETDARLVRESLLALARTGVPRDAETQRRVLDALRARLSDADRSTVEAAVVALGGLRDPEAALTLGELCADEDAPTRLRAFAAYGLGAACGPGAPPELRRYAAHVLTQTLRDDEGARRRKRGGDTELQAAAVIGLGLAPVPGRAGVAEGAPPTAGIEPEVRFLLDVLRDDRRPRLVRAHVPTAVARLLASEEAGAEPRPGLRMEVVDALLEALADGEDVAVRRSAVIALGEVGNAGSDVPDVRAKVALLEARRSGDLASRRFATIGLARIAARPGAEGARGARFEALPEIERELAHAVARGKLAERSWSALALGVLGHDLRREGRRLSADSADVLLRVLARERNPSEAAVYALALGLIGDARAIDATEEAMGDVSDEGFRSILTVALGALRQESSLPTLQRLARESDHRPLTLASTSAGRALIGDAVLVQDLVDVLAACDCVTSAAGVSKGLARTDDDRAVGALTSFAMDPSHPTPSRAEAVRALGWLGQCRAVPWDTRMGAFLNYMDPPEALSDPSGAGVLDL